MFEFLQCMNCLLATGLFGSMLYTMLNYKKSKIMKRFSDSLSPEQSNLYKQIMKERMTIYVKGLILGLVVGLIYLNYNTHKQMSRACIFTVIVLGINHLYYGLVPKTKWMLPSLSTEEQRTAWLEIYKEMKYRCIMGFVLGSVSYILLGYSMK
jgi:uncharacterized membrane protein